jgi:hypothetical protein
MNGQQIYLKTVDDLRIDTESNKPIKFWVPAYQRGFRWQPLQVTQLIDDIREFTLRRDPQPEEFYCLQPLVLKARSKGEFEVVDGQQRLTTLFLIMRHFNERLTDKYRQTLFTMAYETRPNLDEFMKSPSDETANDNADYFHLYKAIQAIEEWFLLRDSEVEAIKSSLLNKTKVIWFELAERDNPVDAFTRLNVGKIPLTNDELIRALFLRCTGIDRKESENNRMRIAYEWDQLEKGLQSDPFWYFLSNQCPPGQNRISFIFDLVARTEGMSYDMANDAYGLFYFFNQRIKEAVSTPETEWRRIKQTYLMLEEWFEDRTLFHMVGFLVSQDISIKDIQTLSLNCTKSEFVQNLRQSIFERVIVRKPLNPFNTEAVRMDVADCLEEIKYGSNGRRVSPILLLFNVATLLQNQRSNLRFQFDSFKTEQWDIEHIRSVSDDKPDRDYKRKDWLQMCLGYLKLQDDASEICSKIVDFIDLSQVEATNERFDSLYEEILHYFNEATEGEAVNGIANLTLLDKHTNRSYKNAPFAVKRQRILDLDQHGIFVPLCTRNIFLKCYSPQVENAVFWGEKDQQGYQEAIIDVLVNFFCGKQEGIL